jgi:hypothetical protein
MAAVLVTTPLAHIQMIGSRAGGRVAGFASLDFHGHEIT